MSFRRPQKKERKKDRERERERGGTEEKRKRDKENDRSPNSRDLHDVGTRYTVLSHVGICIADASEN